MYHKTVKKQSQMRAVIVENLLSPTTATTAKKDARKNETIRDAASEKPTFEISAAIHRLNKIAWNAAEEKPYDQF